MKADFTYKSSQEEKSRHNNESHDTESHNNKKGHYDEYDHGKPGKGYPAADQAQGGRPGRGAEHKALELDTCDTRR